MARGMKKISHKGYRFPLEIIQQAIWLYVRITLSLRDVEVSWSKWRPLKRSSMLNMRVSFVAGRICRQICTASAFCTITRETTWSSLNDQ